MNDWEHSLLESPRVEAFRQWLIQSIPVSENDQKSLHYLQAGGLQEPLVAYLNWVRRFIPPRPRQWIDAWQWPGMRNIPVQMYLRHADHIEVLKRDIMAGADINGRISKKVRVGYQRGSSNKGWVSRNGGDKDFLLNAYGLHHVHLKKSIDALLYCVIDKERFFFIHLGDHDFQKPDLDDAITRWRDAQGLELKLIEPDMEPWLHRDRRRVELSGGMVIRNFEGRALIGAMLTTSGHSIDCVRYADAILIEIENIEKLIHCGAFKNYGYDSDGRNISYCMYYSDFCFQEAASGKNYIVKERWL